MAHTRPPHASRGLTNTPQDAGSHGRQIWTPLHHQARFQTRFGSQQLENGQGMLHHKRRRRVLSLQARRHRTRGVQPSKFWVRTLWSLLARDTEDCDHVPLQPQNGASQPR